MFIRSLNRFQRNLLLAADDGNGGGNGSSGNGSGGSSGGAGGDAKDKVAYETYQKVLDEKKSIQSKQTELESQLSELQKKVQEAEAEKLKASGDKDAYIKTLETNLQNEKTKYETELTKFKLTKVVSSFREVAVKEGCQNVDDLQKLFADKFKDIKVNPVNFDVDSESVASLISQAKEKSSYLFTPKKIKIDDINLNTGGNADAYKEELKKCKTQKEFDAVRKKYGRA